MFSPMIKGPELNLNLSPHSPESRTIKGRLLTPEEGCGLAEAQTGKIVGGGVYLIDFILQILISITI